jgi:inhibitor of cysteine peptidase
MFGIDGSKTMIRSALAFAFIITAIPMAAHAQTATDATLRLARGKMARIELQENPSTGYKWQLDRQGSSNLEIVGINDLGFDPAASAGQKRRLGAPGQHRWTIEALAAGRATVIFTYSRPWEQLPPTRRHKVTVEIR